MSAELNHTIVRVRDKRESAQFLAEILGLGDPEPFGPFLVVQTGNGVSLDFADDHGPVSPQHYAFLVSESDFDQIFGRIRDRPAAALGRPRQAPAGPVQYPRRRPGRVLGGPQRPLPGDHHSAVRQRHLSAVPLVSK